MKYTITRKSTSSNRNMWTSSNHKRPRRSSCDRNDHTRSRHRSYNNALVDGDSSDALFTSGSALSSCKAFM